MRRVMVFGTFDKLHAGHRNLFEQAHRYGDFLIVVVGRDSTVQSLKGVAPQQSEHERLQAVAAHPLVGHAVLGEQLDFYQVVRQQQPAVIILGYDQVSPMTKGLADAFPNIQIIRGQAFEPETYKSSKLRHAKTADRHA